MAPVYSPTEILRQKDFDKLAPNELDAVHDMMAQIVWEWGERRTRRHVLEGAGLLDFRRSLRRNLRYGTEVLEWSFRAPKVKPRALVVIADISGSMQRYTRLVLQYLYGLKHGLPQRVEVFIFGTQLTRVTRQFAHRDIDKALREVTEAAQDWSGGTNIGGAIKTFNYRWARKVLSGGAVVLLISDGWDRGDPVLLSQEMARLRRLCHRLIWLNPLLGSESYEPLTRGMQAALPNIDDFLPAHNLASLEDLARHLHNISDRGAPGVPLRLTGPAFVGGRTDRRIRLTA